MAPADGARAGLGTGRAVSVFIRQLGVPLIDLGEDWECLQCPRHAGFTAA
jgi:ribose 5-phosphate isomerase